MTLNNDYRGAADGQARTEVSWQQKLHAWGASSEAATCACRTKYRARVIPSWLKSGAADHDHFVVVASSSF